MKARYMLWLGLGLLTVSLQVVAQDSNSLAPYEEYGKHLRAAEEVTPLTSNLFGDQTSLYNGSTEFDVTDIDLPGNSHLPVKLGRRLSIDDRRLNPGNLGGFGDWDVEVPYIDGSFIDSDGWTVIGANDSQSYARCSTTMQPYTVVDGNSSIVASATAIWDGDQLHIPGAINEELLANTETMLPAVADGKSYPWITKSFYRATCASSTANGYPGESFVVVSPTGDRYTFNWAVVNYQAGMQFQYPNPAGGGSVKGATGRSHIFLLATEVDDRFGNWVKYSYNSSNQLTGITANDGRSITVNWTGNYITSASTGTRTWSYGYTDAGALTYTDTDASGTTNVTINSLSSVTRPDGSAWKYSVTSGTLKTKLAAPDIEPPPEYHCQIDPDPNIGDLVYAMDAPSGAHGIFHFSYQRNIRKYVPKSCTGTVANTLYPLIYDFADNFALLSKQITGAGLATQTWSYDYDPNDGNGYIQASVPFPGNVETYIPQSATAYASPKVVTVTDPSAITKYSFGINYGVDEGRLLGTETDALNGTVMKTVTSTYLPDSSISTQAFPSNVGQSVQSIAKNPMVGRLRPETAVVTVQVPEGDTYTRQTNGFDVFAHPTDVVRSNNIGYQRSIEEKTTYFNDYSQWVIGLTQEVDNLSNNGEVESLNTYNSNATLAASARFGETLLTYGYNVQGQISSFVDGNSHTTKLDNYYRGIPQLITYPDNTTQSAVVDDYGDISSVTDQRGYTTSYTYNPIGWPSSITYPAGDTVAWYPKNYTFTYVADAERGIAGGHWRRTVSTGNNNEVTYFDAMLQPLLTDTNIGTPGSDITSEAQYDPKGQKVFVSYPVSGTPNVGDSSIAKGTHSTYDALERLIQAQQDSELGALITTTAYTGSAHKVVTDPKGNVTTTFYQVFDEPSYDTPIQVVAPTGITQNITRDLYGNPTVIYQAGMYGSESDSLSKYFYYDSYHRLCRTTEPESGSEITTYDAANNVQTTATGLTISGTDCGTSPTASQTAYTYDAMNRVLTIQPPAGTQSTTYTYDPMGHLSSASSGISYWWAGYNTLGNITGEALWLTGQNAWGIGYSYDAYGHLSAVGYPGGETVTYAPDALGRATQAGSYASAVTYFPNNDVSSFTYGNGNVYVAELNARQMVGNFSYGTASTVNLSEDLIYDANGNITNVNDLVNGPRAKTFGYDALNRLTSAQASGLNVNEAYTYDALNNLRSRLTGGVTFNLNYDANNRLNTLTNASGTTATYSYDALGNRQSATNGSATTSYVFDAKNQLLQIPGVDTYAYDASGRRIAKTTAGGSSTYSFYSKAGQLMYQAVPSIGQATNFIYLGSKLIARDVYTQLAAPASVTFDANPNNGSYTVSWTAVTTATSYNAQESANGGAWTAVFAGSGTSVALSGKAGGSYVYQVQACTSTGCGPWTSSATLGVRPALPTVTVPSGTVNGTYTVSWTVPVSATTFDVQERVNGGAWTTIASATATTSISRPGTTSGSYTYQVDANNAYGNRGWASSSAVTVDTSYGVLPSIPTSFTVPASSTTGSATLSWGTANLVTSYTVQQSTNGGASWSTVYTGASTSAALSGLVDGSYTYQLQACNQYGCSAWVRGGTLAVLLPPPEPASMTVPGSSSGSVPVSWAASATATSYTLQHADYSVTGWSTIYSGAATSFTQTETVTGAWIYQVQACNSSGCSAFRLNNAGVLLTIPPNSAPGLTVPASSNSGSYAVSWSAVTGAATYTLQQRLNGGAWSTVQATSATSDSVSGEGSGSYGYQVQACNAGGCGPWSGIGTTVVTIPVPIAINGQSYTESYGITQTNGSAAIGFEVVNGAWDVWGAKPFATHTVLISGAVPSTAVTVQYIWTLIGPPVGTSASTGTLVNPAASPVAITSNPSSDYATSVYTIKSNGNGEQYQLTVNFFNAAGANVSSSTCTLTAKVIGTE